MTIVRAGKLNRRITIQKKTLTQDATGADIPIFTDYKTVWASIVPLIGKEFNGARQINSEITHLIKIRYDSELFIERYPVGDDVFIEENSGRIEGVFPKWRIKYGSRYFDVLFALDSEERHFFVTLQCREVVNSGV